MLTGYERTHVKIDLDAIKNNMAQMKANIGEHAKMIGVIKADGYGHGAVPIALILEEETYLYGFATATLEEALILRRAGIQKPLLILGAAFEYGYQTMAEQEIRPSVFREDMLEGLQKAAELTGKKIHVHVKVDTGMARIGIRPDDEGLAFVRKVLNCDGLELEGIFTHFSRADEADKTNAMQQFSAFYGFVDRIRKELDYQVPISHCANSAGIVELTEASLDAVRAGITLYGLWPSSEIRKDIISLRPALAWESTVVFVKEILKGTPVGYGGTFIAPCSMTIATIPVGYGDGYPRSLSNYGAVLIRGKRAPVIGRICMDQFMVDVSGIEGTKDGDRVILIGRDGDECITAEELGELSGRFNYELVCDIGKRVPRIYYKNGRIFAIKDYYDDYGLRMIE